MVVVASFSKVCVFSERDPSTRQRYHYNIIVLKSFYFGDRLQNLSFLIVFVWVRGENAKKSLRFERKRYENVFVLKPQ